MKTKPAIDSSFEEKEISKEPSDLLVRVSNPAGGIKTPEDVKVPRTMLVQKLGVIVQAGRISFFASVM